MPFSEIHIADADKEKCAAAAKRIANAGGAAITDVGPAENTAARIVARLNKYKLHFAFLDPFNLDDLPFIVVEAFSRLKRIDMLMSVDVPGLATQSGRIFNVRGWAVGSFCTGLEIGGEPKAVKVGNARGLHRILGFENGGAWSTACPACRTSVWHNEKSTALLASIRQSK